ncbi:MAG: hypothetical protein LC792_12370 [Actinobacteria bacterium]|nr:hypothetical protein [Actinomycetota bacterium]
MGDHEEGIVLTDREREALAGLAESIGDPWLARQLAGGAQAPPPPQRRLARLTDRRAKLEAATGWTGLALVLAGAALAVITFMYSTVVASLGLLLMGVGLWRFVDQKGAGIVSRLSAKRPPTIAPSPPRTPPAAA